MVEVGGLQTLPALPDCPARTVETYTTTKLSVPAFSLYIDRIKEAVAHMDVQFRHTRDDLLSPVLLFAVPSGVRAWRAKHPKREA